MKNNPTTKSLAEALNVSPRRVSQLRAAGMPCTSISEALEWRAKQETSHANKSDSAEQLRRERIQLVKSQREKIDIENRVRRGELISGAEVQNQATRVYSRVRGELLRLASDLPPRLAGLSEGPMQGLIRAAIVEILTDLSNETTYTEQA